MKFLKVIFKSHFLKNTFNVINNFLIYIFKRNYFMGNDYSSTI